MGAHHRRYDARPSPRYFRLARLSAKNRFPGRGNEVQKSAQQVAASPFPLRPAGDTHGACEMNSASLNAPQIWTRNVTQHRR